MEEFVPTWDSPVGIPRGKEPPGALEALTKKHFAAENAEIAEKRKK